MSLLVSTNASRGDPAGGVLEVDGWRVTRRDATPTTGMCMVDGVLATARWTREGPTRIDIGEASIVVPAADPHDLAWDGEHLVVVSTGTNEVLWCDLAGHVVRRWCPDPTPDSWHLSGLTIGHGSVVVSAFGRGDTERGWADDLDTATGFLLDVDSGAEIASGLCTPHSPVWADGWWWCESHRGRIHGPSGSAPVGGWARGLAVTDDFVFVGVSPPRGTDDSRSFVAVFDRVTLQPVAAVDVDTADIFTILVSGEPVR